MTERLLRFLRQSYPPVPYLLTALLLASGLTGLAAAGDPRASWAPDLGLAVTTITLFGNLLFIRALDDIRDLEYDRAHNPQRPLAAGVVRVTDLVTMITVGSVVLLAGNAWRGAAGVLLCVELAYLGALMYANIRLNWPATENLLVHLPLNVPVQLLLCGYVYAGWLADRQLRPTARGLLAVVAVVLVMLYVEFARKTTRSPGPSERTYVHQLGLGGTVTLGFLTALLATACAVVAAGSGQAGGPAGGWGWLALAPLALIGVAGWRFWRGSLPRWPLAPTLGFAFASYLAFVAIGLLTGVDR